MSKGQHIFSYVFTTGKETTIWQDIIFSIVNKFFLGICSSFFFFILQQGHEGPKSSTDFLKRERQTGGVYHTWISVAFTPSIDGTPTVVWPKAVQP